MPTILFIEGWRFFFYSNEGNEPIHIHAEKGDMECKYWLKEKEYEIEEAFGFNLTPAARRDLRRIIFQHFDYFIAEWKKHFNQ